MHGDDGRGAVQENGVIFRRISCGAAFGQGLLKVGHGLAPRAIALACSQIRAKCLSLLSSCGSGDGKRSRKLLDATPACPVCRTPCAAHAVSEFPEDRIRGHPSLERLPATSRCVVCSDSMPRAARHQRGNVVWFSCPIIPQSGQTK